MPKWGFRWWVPKPVTVNAEGWSVRTKRGMDTGEVTYFFKKSVEINSACVGWHKKISQGRVCGFFFSFFFSISSTSFKHSGLEDRGKKLQCVWIIRKGWFGSPLIEGVWCCEAAPEVLHPVLDAPISEWHGGTSESPVEGYQGGGG